MHLPILRRPRHALLGAVLFPLLLLPMLPAGASASSDLPVWRWPIAGVHTPHRDFLAPETPYSAGHRGIDLAAAPGTSVLAVADGTVSFAGPVAGRNVLTIDHGGGWKSSYEPVTAQVGIDTHVLAGQPVATLDESAGHATESVLHLGARYEGAYVSPLLLLGAEGAVLLPWETETAHS